MSSLLSHTQNTRSILGDNYRYIRSDVPQVITPDERNWLLGNNIRTIVDLREETEREKKPCPLEKDKEFRYLCMPVSGGNAIPAKPEDVSVSYLKMVDEQMWNIIDAIENADSNVLYFCNAGKDRTGVVSAMLLKRMGKGREYIVDDYVESAEKLREMLLAFVKVYPEVDLEVITPVRRYMEIFLDNCPERSL